MLSMGSLQKAGDTIGWVWYLLVVLVVLALIIGWIYQQSKAQKKKEEQEKTTEKQAVPAASELPKNEKVETRNDDLTQIEGIGPKVAGVLKNAGITSFDSLASADPAEVKNVLNEAGLQMMNPEGWIEQAELAAKEDWDGLQKLQDELKGGRRR
jgi:predicted flap endonuclease-1-like 5' DNA nuclease